MMWRARGRRGQMQMREVVAVMMVIKGHAAGARPAGVKENHGSAGWPDKDRLPVPDQPARLLHHRINTIMERHQIALISN